MRLLHSFTILLLLPAILFLSACSEKTSPVDNSVVEVEQTIEQPDAVAQITITGKFRSVSGVMDELSCYCSNGGYVTAQDGTITAVCFEESVASCDKITITGYMTSRSIEMNGACPEGMMGFLKVQSYIVGETDY